MRMDRLAEDAELGRCLFNGSWAANWGFVPVSQAEMSAMIKAFLNLLAARRGEMTAEVTAARALTAEQQASVAEAIKRAVGSKVTIDVKVDPSLLGGLVVRVGSRMIDSSLKTKLQKLQLAMKGIG